MSYAKHTPGPWRAYDEYPEIIEFSTKGGGDFGGMKVSVSGINYRTGMHVMAAEQAANMRLIAAAPDLLALLVELVDIEGPMPGTSAWGDKARDAIAKATGGKP